MDNKSNKPVKFETCNSIAITFFLLVIPGYGVFVTS